MIKKLASLAGAGALLLGMAGVALAQGPVPGLVWNFNQAWVETSANASANTGRNSQNDVTWFWGEAKGDDYMATGVASAQAGAVTVANQNTTALVSFCGECGSDLAVFNDNWASVYTGANASANTGRNSQNDVAGNFPLHVEGGGHHHKSGDAEGDDRMVTGPAYAKSFARTWANINTTTIVPLGM